MIALLDNTVLSNFTVVERADLIQLALGADAATTQIVWDELQAGIDLGKIPPQDWSWLSVLSVTETEQPLYRLLTQWLNAGEASCLAIAANRGYRVFTDDRDARELATGRHIPVSGTLGLLLLLVDSKFISLVIGDKLLTRMISAGYYSPVTTLQDLS
jgi:predicted nucleic acid-binding protein